MLSGFGCALGWLLIGLTAFHAIRMRDLGAMAGSGRAGARRKGLGTVGSGQGGSANTLERDRQPDDAGGRMPSGPCARGLGVWHRPEGDWCGVGDLAPGASAGLA